MLSSDPATSRGWSTSLGPPVCVRVTSWSSAGRRWRGSTAVPGCAGRARRVEQRCDRTMVGGSCLRYRATIVGRDVSWLAFPTIFSPHHQCLTFLPFLEELYHLNVFGGPPGLVPGVIIFPGSASAIYQAGEMGHGPTEQRFVT